MCIFCTEGKLESVANSLGLDPFFPITSNSNTEDGDCLDNLNTSAEIPLGGSFIGNLYTEDDADWIAVSLRESEYYSVDLMGFGENALFDPFLSIYDENAKLIASNDDFGTGYDSNLIFSPEKDGLFYIEASAYDQAYQGDYQVYIEQVDPSSPLDSLVWQNARLDNSEVVNVYFAMENSSLYDEGSLIVSDGFSSEQIAAISGIFENISSFANIHFEYTSNQLDADIKLATSDLGAGLLGYMYPQNSSLESDGLGVLNSSEEFWNPSSTQIGGFMYSVIIHEIGHGLGLAHPHDTGGGSNLMLGVSGPGDTGDYGNINQSIYTIMSYNDGWTGHPQDLSENVGFMSTFGALDIAVLQSYYGSNQTHNHDASNYELGVYEHYQTIWDTGGIDEIVVNSASDSVVDLRAASLEYEMGGAGYVSFVNDTVGGFTIANGTTIENASGGSGSDLINGNLVSNLIYGNEGNDTICGADGDDIIFGGLGDDIIEGGCGNDILDGGSGNNTFLIRSGEGTDIINNYDLSTDSILFENSDGEVINNDQISRERSEDGSRKYILNQDTAFTLSGIMNFSAVGQANIDLSGFDNGVLNADISGISDADGIGNLSFQWFRDGIELIEETDSAFSISREDMSAELHYEVSFEDGFGTNECLCSDTIKIEQDLFPNHLPTGLLTISGEFVVGQVISLDTSDIQDTDGLGAFVFAWLRDGNIIVGAQSEEYLLADIDVDTSISAQVSYIDKSGILEIVESISSHKIERPQNDVGQENLDAASDVTTTSSMLVDGSFSGTLSSGDYSDWIGVDLISGEDYNISLSGVGQDAVEDTYLSMFDANGAFIASDDDSGSDYNSLLSVTADYSGRFYLEAQSYYSYDIGDYEIKIDLIA